MTPREQLDQGLVRLGLDLPVRARETLIDYVALLAKWNRTYNLTAIREPSAVVSNHLLDSLAALPFIKAAKVLDVGSGAGLPGLVVAIARPEVSVTLLDANNKKAAFLQQAVANLALPNARVVCTRVETWRPGEFFPAIVSRAFAALKDFIAGTKELLAPGGRFYAMKGQYPADEIAQLPRGFRVVDVVSLEVPGLAARRHLVIVEEEHVR